MQTAFVNLFYKLHFYCKETTLADYLLYMISEDSDTYLLTLIASGQAEDFEQEMQDISPVRQEIWLR